MCRGKLGRSYSFRGWFAAGTILRVSWDSEAGSLSAFSRLAGADASNGAAVYQSGVLPGAKVGAGLFPVVSGKGGARIRWRSAGEPLSAPTSGGQVRAAAGALCRCWQPAVMDNYRSRHAVRPYGAS